MTTLKNCQDCSKSFKPGSNAQIRCRDCKLVKLRAYYSQYNSNKRSSIKAAAAPNFLSQNREPEPPCTVRKMTPAEMRKYGVKLTEGNKKEEKS